MHCQLSALDTWAADTLGQRAPVDHMHAAATFQPFRLRMTEAGPALHRGGSCLVPAKARLGTLTHDHSLL